MLSPVLLNAQGGKNEAGLRGGCSWGANLRLFSDETNAAEALLSFRDGGIQLAAIREKFMPALLTYSGNIFFYYGYGGHLGFTTWWREKYLEDYDAYTCLRRAAPLAGIDGAAGIEYRFYKMPLTAGFDFKPFAEIGGQKFFRINLWDFGINIRYNFK